MSSDRVENDARDAQDTATENATTAEEEEQASGDNARRTADPPKDESATDTDLHNEEKVEYEPVEHEQVIAPASAVEEVGQATSSKTDDTMVHQRSLAHPYLRPFTTPPVQPLLIARNRSNWP
jgi:hypothetical protein